MTEPMIYDALMFCCLAYTFIRIGKGLAYLLACAIPNDAKLISNPKGTKQ